MTVNIVTPDNLERFAEGSKEKFARASHTHSNATTSKAGFMSAEDKQNLNTLVQEGLTLSPATANKLGGVKVGANLSVTADGTLSADAQQYTLPTASADTLGGVKVGTNLSISNGVLSATNTDTKVTSVGNHYTPSTDASSALTSSASSTGAYALNTEYDVVTGITLSRDAKGHVTGISTMNQKVKDTNTTYSSKTASSGGTDVSLVTTGEKYTWNNKSNLAIGTTATTAAAGNHNHDSTYLKLAGGTVTGDIACSTSGADLKWGNITIYGGGSNGGTNSMYIGDDVTIGDCNAGGILGMKSTGTNCGFQFYNSSGGSLGKLQTTNGTLQWINTSGTATNISLSDHTHTTSLATDSGTATVTLAHDTTYKLTAGGTSVIFKTPADNNTDTKNTAGSTNSTSKLFLVGATSQADNPQTYSHSGVYATNGALVAVSFQATSDKRKKTNIKELEDLNLSGIKSYNYTLTSNGERRTGLIAQEVMYVIPDAVKADEKGYLSLDYNAVVAVLVAKVNKLEARIKELENK